MVTKSQTGWMLEDQSSLFYTQESLEITVIKYIIRKAHSYIEMEKMKAQLYSSSLSPTAIIGTMFHTHIKQQVAP
jgi:hypothetical protein